MDLYSFGCWALSHVIMSPHPQSPRTYPLPLALLPPTSSGSLPQTLVLVCGRQGLLPSGQENSDGAGGGEH